MKDPREIQQELRQRETRAAAMRALKLLLRTQQACSRPQLSALFNCVDYVARHTLIFQDPDAQEVMELGAAYAGFTGGQRAKVAGWLSNGRPPHIEHEQEDEECFFDDPDEF